MPKAAERRRGLSSSRLPIRLVWKERRPSGELERLLEGRGAVVLEREDPADAVALHVVATAGVIHAAPVGPVDRPWVWLHDGPLSPAALRSAGALAYDIVDRTRPPEEVVDRLVARAREVEVPLEPPPHAPGLVSRSPAAQRLLRDIAHAAATSMPVLLTGETGSGKEVLTRLIHDWSARRRMPFVPVNCAAIPHEMLEAELFGYARGAFSGAVKGYEGQLRAAEGGSVFLDEVDDTPPSFQIKLLRVLEDRVVGRLGESTWHKVDFRILAATNRDLEQLIEQGLFAADLFERLAIVKIRVPPLRERREDIPGLCEHLIARFYVDEPNALSRHAVERITEEAMSLLLTHDWPGNIRELRNVLYAGLVRKRAGRELLISDLPPQLFQRRAELHSPPGEAIVDRARLRTHIETGRFNLRETVARLERDALELALERAHGNAASAATLLGEVGRGSAKSPGATVRAMMRRLGIAAGRD